MGTRAHASTGGGDEDVEYVVSELFNRTQFMKTNFFIAGKTDCPLTKHDEETGGNPAVYEPRNTSSSAREGEANEKEEGAEVWS